MSIKGEEFFFSLFYPFLNLYLKFRSFKSLKMLEIYVFWNILSIFALGL